MRLDLGIGADPIVLVTAELFARSATTVNRFPSLVIDNPPRRGDLALQFVTGRDRRIDGLLR
jgi:hypothetical protein